MKLTPFSSRTQRISSELNCKLSILIPVIYGAVLSYSAYIFAEQVKLIFLNIDYVELIDRGALSKFFKFAILYFIFTAYLLSDVGAIIKIESEYPFQTTSRYSWEMVIALLYVGLYSILPTLNIGIFFIFSIIILFGGIWYNNFKEEFGDIESLVVYSRLQRNLHYLGWLMICGPFVYFVFQNQSNEITFVNLVVFAIAFLFWHLLSIYSAIVKHGDRYLKYNVNILFPDKWFNKVES